MKKGLKSVPKNSIFSLPGIVENMAAPFLKGLCRAAEGDDIEEVVSIQAVSAEKQTELNAEPKIMSGFQALDELYRSIANVLDHEKLYKTILEKST